MATHVDRKTRASRSKSSARYGETGPGRDIDPDLYPHQLQFYTLPPVDEVSLEEFERLAVERLKVLKDVELVKIRFPTRDDKFSAQMREKTKVFLPLIDAANPLEIRRRDHVSHFILRLAYCRTEELRRWFLTQECELFRYRLENQSANDITHLLELQNLKYTVVDETEKMSIDRFLRSAALGGDLGGNVKNTEYFKVPFEQALDLVRGRRHYISNGNVYVPREDMTPIIVGAFRLQLSASLAATARALPDLEEDSRLLPMLNSLSQRYLGNEYRVDAAGRAGQVAPADIPSLAKQSFPLCMRTAQEKLAEAHHLRHGARMQYGLFLKGIGLSLEDALLFWRTEFSRAMSIDKFDKQYAYNIRHNYGKEGKRADYTPYSCMRIIMGEQPGTGDAHGCPFRHYNAENLRVKLHSYGVPTNSISEISKLVSEHHYQIACGRYFEVTHNCEPNTVSIQHPNQYFDDSRQILTNGEHKTTFLGGQSNTEVNSPVGASSAGQSQELMDDELVEAMDAAADM
ncbi:uncharacterized protein MONBRDRAFT_32834 [Monosiga brevicollis MX1]|uniref:DNA primase large subunit n=1 Tax=Monosiga brevicollis TaxID=81824 RepID=A9V1Z7_MONBE|nr:uncharacterized protein MONBRDRAFT_32834 [Monosiga brevicollis MX1]EDQ88653.1 predicted protein [Monosiga brevicollis MX1]|eukprot:XP_001746757.1 hypothetical protein [Monosiga brevicollis MX1]